MQNVKRNYCYSKIVNTCFPREGYTPQWRAACIELYMQSINAHNGWFPINQRPYAIGELFTYELEICTFFIFAIRNRSINLSKVTGTNGFVLNTPLVKIHLNIANGKLKVKLRCHLGKHYLVDQGRRVGFLSGALVVTLA